jgi:hypothetical protein
MRLLTPNLRGRLLAASNARKTSVIASAAKQSHLFGLLAGHRSGAIASLRSQ